MLFNLLTGSTESTSTPQPQGFPWFWVIIGLFLVFIIVSNAINNKKRREQMEAEKEKRNAIKPGFKVTTIGGILGTVVDVDDEANTFVLQTGTDECPCYLKFDKVAIYNSEDPNAPVEEPASEEFFNEDTVKVDETADEVVDETVDVVDETVAEVVDETINTIEE